ncbi:MAG: hypothetical protein HOQ10_04860 [Frateuria sp.]|nr:hypothetical protein [Frateuria sp.]
MLLRSLRVPDFIDLLPACARPLMAPLFACPRLPRLALLPGLLLPLVRDVDDLPVDAAIDASWFCVPRKARRGAG